MRGLHLFVLIGALAPVVAVAQDKPPAAPKAPAAWSDADVARGFASDDPVVRRATIASVRGRWPAAATAIPALVSALDDESDDVRRAAVAEIAELSVRAAAVLADHLDAHARGAWKKLPPKPVFGSADEPGAPDGSPDELVEGIVALGPAVTPLDLIQAATWKGGIWRREVIATTAGVRMAPLLTSELDEQFPAVLLAYGTAPETADLIAAALALQARASCVRRGIVLPSGAAPEGVSRWVRHLGAGAPTRSRLAAMYLARWGPAGADAAAAIRKTVRAEPVEQDPTRAGAWALIEALQSQGPLAPADIVLLREREAAGCDASSAALIASIPVDDLIRRVRASGEPRAVERLAALTPLPKEAVPVLTDLLLTQHGTALVLAARAVAAASGGPQPELVRTLEEERSDSVDTQIALCWLAGLPEERVKRLGPAVSTSDVSAAICGMGPAAAPLAESLKRVIDSDPATGYRRDLAAAAALGPAARSLVPGIVRIARLRRTPNADVPWDRQWAAILALERIGPAAAESLPALEELRKSGSPGTAYLAGRAARAVKRK